jgi:hypothetical protein
MSEQTYADIHDNYDNNKGDPYDIDLNYVKDIRELYYSIYNTDIDQKILDEIKKKLRGKTIADLKKNPPDTTIQQIETELHNEKRKHYDNSEHRKLIYLLVLKMQKEEESKLSVASADAAADPTQTAGKKINKKKSKSNKKKSKKSKRSKRRTKKN